MPDAWTTALPTEPGFYWHRCKAKPCPRVVEVYPQKRQPGGVLTTDAGVYRRPVGEAPKGSEWCGPIQQPKG